MLKEYESKKERNLIKLRNILQELLLDHVCGENEYIETLFEHFSDILHTENSNKRMGFTDFPDTDQKMYMYQRLGPKEVSNYCTVLDNDLQVAENAYK